MKKIHLLPALLLLVSFAALGATLLSLREDAHREAPGNRLSPGLARMINDALTAELKRVPELHAAAELGVTASLVAREWLAEVKEVVARCRRGPDDETKWNLMEYDVSLYGGGSVEGLYSGLICEYGSKLPPLVMRVRWSDGQVVDVLTDGRERGASPSTFEKDAAGIAAAVIRAGQDRKVDPPIPPMLSATENTRAWDELALARHVRQ